MVEVDQTLFQTGDVLIGRRFTGDSTQWMLMEGGFANHAAIVYAPQGSNFKFVMDCAKDRGYIKSDGGVMMTELN